MRYKISITRVQVADRYYRAPSEEEAAAKAQAEFDRPYGYFGSWKTVGSEVEITAVEPTATGAIDLKGEGPMLLTVKDAAKALGLGTSTLYQLLQQGDLDWVAVGSRKYISRDHLLEFIKRNTHNGYR